MATQVPLKILLTDPSLIDHPDIQEQIQKLNKAGHHVVVNAELLQYDFIAGPNCWLLRPEVAGLFNMAVTNARKIVNADKQRVDAHNAAKTSKAKPKRAGSTGTRSKKAKAPVPAERDTALAGQLGYTTYNEADPEGGL